MRRRDHKEQELKSLESGIRNNELLCQKRKTNFEFQLKLYQDWKKQEGVEGINY